jgi:hypothetical protein
MKGSAHRPPPLPLFPMLFPPHFNNVNNVNTKVRL